MTYPSLGLPPMPHYCRSLLPSLGLPGISLVFDNERQDSCFPRFPAPSTCAWAFAIPPSAPSIPSPTVASPSGLTTFFSQILAVVVQRNMCRPPMSDPTITPAMRVGVDPMFITNVALTVWLLLSTAQYYRPPYLFFMPGTQYMPGQNHNLVFHASPLSRPQRC